MVSAALSNQRWFLFLVLILVGLIQSLCFLGLVYEAKTFVESGVYVLSLAQGVGIVSVIFILAIGRFLERFIAEKFAQHYVMQLREQIFEFTLSLPASDRDLLNGGATLLRLTNDMSAIRNWVVQGLAPLTVLSVWLLIAVTGLIQIHWTMGLILLPCLLVTVAGNYCIGTFLYSSSERARKSRGNLIRTTAEKLRQFYLIKAFNQKGKEKRQFRKRSKRLLKHQITKAKVSALLRGFNEAALLGTVFVLFISAMKLQAQGIISVESIAVLLTAGLYLLSQMRRLSRLYELWTLKQVAVDKLSGFFNRSPEGSDGRKALPSRPLKIKLRKIEVKQRVAPLSANLEQSARVVLTGGQGIGKSSLLMALAGLLPLDKGKLVFNGRDSAKFHPSLWGKTVSLISPELPLLKGSLRDNLFYGARKAHSGYTDDVLKLTRIRSEELDQVLISESGRNVPDGFSFRFKLARALLRKPKLLLIDNEPALKDPQIISILGELFESFEGAIIIATEIPELARYHTARWNLENNVVEHELEASGLHNVVLFQPPLVKGES
ncbi:MAG: ATP-binding cassette domain-containing protein [Neptuniibacter sp.]